MNPIRHLISMIVLATGLAMIFTPTAHARGGCGVPVQVKGAQSILPPVTLAAGQDLKVHLANFRNQEIRLSVAYFMPGADVPLARAEASMAPGESLDVALSDATCHLKVCMPEAGDEPFALQPVISVVFERPVTIFQRPAGIDDPALGYDDPALGFDDPALGFDDPALGYDDPALGFEVVDESGRTAIWGSGGVRFGFIPADRF